MNLLWYLTAPDGRYPWKQGGARQMDYAYLQQLARAYDHLGFTGALLATGAHDVWVLGASLLPFTERMRFLTAIHPGLVPPVLLAKMAATFQGFSRGRLMLNIVSGDAKMLGAYGMTLAHDERYAMADEYLTVFRRVMAGETVTFKGRYVETVEAKLALAGGEPVAPPALWFGGSSDAAIEVAARHVDTYLSWGETPDEMALKVAAVRRRAAAHGRTLGYGIRLYVIVRETDEAAWAVAQDFHDHMDEAAIAANGRFVAGTDSVGQQRMTAQHGGVKPKFARDLEIAPGLWAGLGLVRPGPGTAIVGSPETVLRILRDYQAGGIETFILSGMPLLEEAYRFAELVLPHLDLATAPRSAPSFTWSNLFDRDLSSKAAG